MRLLVPETPVALASTNVGASALDEWSNASVSYDIGDRVKRTSGFSLPLREYECIQAHTSSDANKPTDGKTNAYWAHTGAVNQHRMFDSTNTLKSVADDPSGNIVVSLTLTTRLQTLLLLGLENASEVRIVETVDGSDVADTTYDLMTMLTPVGYWSHYFGERVYAGSVTHDFYGIAINRTVTLTLTGAATAECAQCLPCKAYELGPTVEGAAPGFKDWSSWEPDDYVGYKYVERETTRNGDYTIWVDTGQFDRIYRLMERMAPKLVALDANNSNTNYDSVRAFGKITRVSPPLGIQYNKMPIDITIEGAG